MNRTHPQFRPPQWAARFLQWYCRPELLEEIEGDVHELFERTARQSPRRARVLFVWNVLRFFRWKNIRRSSKAHRYSLNTSAMIRNYLLTGLRNMIRNFATSMINVVGLSVALACAVLIYILLDSYYNLDAMHEKRDRIYLIANHVKDGDNTRHWANSPALSADFLNRNSAVEQTVQVERGRAAVRMGDKVFQESLWFTDPAFMDVFSFRIIEGDRSALKDPNQVIVIEDVAIKYFGDSDPIGKTLSFKFSDTEKYEFVVGAVAENIPANSSMYFNILVPQEKRKTMPSYREPSWDAFDNVTFVLLKASTTTEQLKPSLESIRIDQSKSNTTFPIQKIETIPMIDFPERTQDVNGMLSWGNSPAAMVAFVVIGTFLVLLAAFNYMNVAVASVSTRLREIGIRKVIGGGKGQLIQQFLIENLLVCFLALTVGTALAYFVLVPGFDSLYPVKIRFEISSLASGVLFFGGLLLGVAIISGSYPAFYVASFNPVSILKGKEKFGNKSLLSKVLLTAQFTLSVTTIICCLVFVWAGYYFEKMDWGYDHEQTIGVPILNASQYKQLRDKASQSKDVLLISGSQSQIGKNNETAKVRSNGVDHNVDHFPVGFGYLEANNLRLVAGRMFDETIESDKREAVVVNESFVRLMGWDDAIGQQVEHNGQPSFVIGVVSDFHYYDFFNRVNPVMFTIVPPEKFNYFVVKAAPGKANVVFGELQDMWREVAPDDPWRGFLQDDVFQGFFTSNRANNTVGFFISGIALLLACMGLYGLVSYNLTRRLKEFSVRKVFGATIAQIFSLMNRDYSLLLFVAFVLGVPLGSYLMNLMITAAYPDPIPVDYTPYAITVTMMALTVGLTVSTQLRRVAKESPAITLRNE